MAFLITVNNIKVLRQLIMGEHDEKFFNRSVTHTRTSLQIGGNARIFKHFFRRPPTAVAVPETEHKIGASIALNKFPRCLEQLRRSEAIVICF